MEQRKKINLSNGHSIVFRESNELRLFEFKSEIMILAVSAIRSIGEKKISDDIINVIRTIIGKVSPEKYTHDLRLAPIWIRKKIEESNKSIVVQIENTQIEKSPEASHMV